MLRYIAGGNDSPRQLNKVRHSSSKILEFGTQSSSSQDMAVVPKSLHLLMSFSGPSSRSLHTSKTVTSSDHASIPGILGLLGLTFYTNIGISNHL